MALVSKIKDTGGTTNDIVDRSAYEMVHLDTNTNLNTYKTPGTYIFYRDSRSGNISQSTLNSPEMGFPFVLKVEAHGNFPGGSGYHRYIQKFTYIGNSETWLYSRNSSYNASTGIDGWSLWGGDKNIKGDLYISSGADTWDGAHTSLKAALTPEVVSDSTVNLNNYTSSGKFILTGSISTRTNFPINQPGYLEVTRWSESSTDWYCRQDFKRYDTTGHQNDSFTRIAKSTDGGSTWSWSAWRSDSYFLPGETYTITNGTTVISYVTSSSTELNLGIWLPKSMKYTNGLSSKPSTVNLIVRGGNGQYLQASNSGYAFKWSDNFRIQPSHLKIKLKKSDGTAFSNCVNNDPYAAEFNGDITITFS